MDNNYYRPTAALEAQRSFAQQVYGWMCIGLGVTALTAYLIARTGFYMTLMPFWWVFALGTLGIGLGFNRAVRTSSFTAVTAWFLGYALCEGLFFGVVLPLYAAAYGGTVIWTAFATASLIFGVACCYGVFTKADLTSIGRILQIGVLGLIGVTLLYFVLSFFMTLTWMNLFISYIGLIIFTGLTAYDAQQIKDMGRQVGGGNDSARMSLVLALQMYINVIMIFWYLVQIFSSGSRRD